MILCIESPKGSTKKLLDLITEFSEVVRYKVNIQKLVAFLYKNKKISEKEIQKLIPFTKASKNN